MSAPAKVCPGHRERPKSLGTDTRYLGGACKTDARAGGWDPKTGEFEKEINKQTDLAFENVERCLKDAGGKGWSQVYRINSYHVPINDEALAAMVRNMRKWMPDHQPLWTCVGVSRLGEDDMRVEVEVVAHDPKN